MNKEILLAKLGSLANNSSTGIIAIDASNNLTVDTTISSSISQTTVAGIYGGTSMTVALTSDSRLFTWGWYGGAGWNLGTGSQTTTGDFMSEIEFPASYRTNGYTITKFRVTAGSYYVLWSNGDLFGWGYNTHGQLGLGNTTSQALPVLLTTNVADILLTKENKYYNTTDLTYSVIKKNDGLFYFAGYNTSGVFGNGTTSDVTTWTAFTPPSGKTIANVWPCNDGAGGTIFIKTVDNLIYAAGLNALGQMGLGNTTSPLSSWQQVTYFNSISDVIDIQCGGYNLAVDQWTMVLTASGNVHTCGYNLNGNCGRGNATSPQTSFAQVSLTKPVASIYQNAWSPYVLFTDGNFARWGYNGQGNLGDGTVTTPVSSPEYGTFTISKIFSSLLKNGSTGTNAIFLLGTDGNLYVSGYNANGCLGLGNVSIGAAVSSFTKVQFNYASNILDMQLSGSSSTGQAWIIALNNSKRLFGAGYNANYELNIPLTGSKYMFTTIPTVF